MQKQTFPNNRLQLLCKRLAKTEFTCQILQVRFFSLNLPDLDIISFQSKNIINIYDQYKKT